MRRRDLLLGGGSTAFACTIGAIAPRAATPPADERVAALLSWLRGRREPSSAADVASRIRNAPTPSERRILAFELIRAMPYRLAKFEPGKPDGLFATGFGDCRHKSIALHRLFQALGENSRTILMPFDWKDLPIPSETLAELAETRGFHDCVEIEIAGRMVLADATWDAALLGAGFPGTIPWDGRSATPAITTRAGPVVLHGSFQNYGELLNRFGIRWPQRQRTLAFNRSFNRWAAALRPQSPVVGRL